ncbi:MAG: TonB-dependent receptor [Gemmatimonadaceae bacterium]
MNVASALRIVLAVATIVLAIVRALPAQGVTSGAISGLVLDDQGQPVDAAQVQIIQRATGYTTSTLSKDDGRFYVQGLEVGGPYSVLIRRIGFSPLDRNDLRISLGQNLALTFRLVRQAAVLNEVTVQGSAEDPTFSPTRTGIGTTLSDSALRRLPTLNRNFTDFVTLTPQISTSGPGLSGAGSNHRYNNIQIDGTSENDLFGLGTTGQPGGQAGGKSISIESVKEYQVLLSPYDVRQGNFAGALINAVTKSGTNAFTGAAYYVFRNQSLAREQTYISDFDQAQYGFSLGGPIIKDKIHFFVNPEFQDRKTPAFGPILGGTGTTVAEASVTQFTQLLGGYNLPAGSSGAIENENPLQNMFARLDFALPWNSRLVLRHNYGYATDDVFSRDAAGTTNPVFRLSSNGYFFQSTKNSTVGQLFTNLSNGLSNELIVGFNTIRDRRTTGARVPQIQVTVPNPAGGNTLLRAGTDNSSQNNELDQDVVEITDNFTIPLGGHRITIGTKNEFFKVRNWFAQNSFGLWEFSSLTNFQNGVPSRYQVGVPVPSGTDGAVRFRAATYTGYVQDQWQLTPTLSLTGGIRLDVPNFRDKPPTNQVVLDSFQRDTRDIPSGLKHWSPRFGFNWDVTGDQRNQLRGGVGVFTGRPAYVWLSNAFQNSGLTGVVQITCTATAALPAFNAANAASPPQRCANSTTAPAVTGDINLAQDDTYFPQTFRASLGFDRDIGYNLVVTLEGLYSRAQNNFFYTNLARDSVGLDRNGRVLYGTLAAGTGIATPKRLGNRLNVIDITNSNKDYSYQLTAGLSRRYANRFEGSLFYTWMKAEDLQSFASSTAGSNLQRGRSLFEGINHQNLSTSRFDQPHRIIAQGTYSLPTRTDISLIYTGQSGEPYDYVYTGSGGRGDLNADAQASNDLVYVPQSASDLAEIRLQATATATVAQQQEALERYINGEECLRKARGGPIERNSCRAPFQNRINVALRQSLPTFRGQNVSVQLDVFNFANLLNKKWGSAPTLNRVFQPDANSSVALLTHVAQTTGSALGSSGSQGIFTFNPNLRTTNTDNLASNYQVQFQVRYSF